MLMGPFPAYYIQSIICSCRGFECLIQNTLCVWWKWSIRVCEFAVISILLRKMWRHPLLGHPWRHDLLRSAVGMTHVLRSGLVMDYTTSYFPLIVLGYSEIDHLHLSIEAQCVSHLLPLGDCHMIQFLVASDIIPDVMANFLVVSDVRIAMKWLLTSWPTSDDVSDVIWSLRVGHVVCKRPVTSVTSPWLHGNLNHGGC